MAHNFLLLRLAEPGAESLISTSTPVEQLDAMRIVPEQDVPSPTMMDPITGYCR